MHKTVFEYIIFFVVLVLLQVFLFDNINLSIYISPLVYVAFIVMLPLNINHALLLLLGLVTGVAMDFFTGMGGLNTIACLATSFLRPAVLNLTIGKEVVREGGAPLPRDLGMGRWLRYVSLLVLVHCIVFFGFEAMTLHYIVFTLLRMVCSAAVTIVLVWFTGMLYPGKSQHAK